MARGPIPDKPRDRPTVPEVLHLACAYYATPGNSTGGNLHVVLEDENLDDGHVQRCLERAEQEADSDGIKLANALLAMTKTQRRRLRRQLHEAERKRYREDPMAIYRV